MFQFCYVEFYAAQWTQTLTQQFVLKPLHNIILIVFSDVEFVSIEISRVTEVKMLRMNGALYLRPPPTCLPGVRRDNLTFTLILCRVITQMIRMYL
jgi:hypothetical protein